MYDRFEESYRKTDDECCELMSLVDWYKNFEYMHGELFAELKRRIRAEAEMEHEVEKYRASLVSKFEEEVKQRKKFADEQLSYLPTQLHHLVEEHPIKYQVYPITKKSALFSLSHESPELFADVRTTEGKAESPPGERK